MILGYLIKTGHTEYRRFCKTLSLENDARLIEGNIKAHAKSAAWPEITQGINYY